jgi:putative ABC transport system permease protein
MLTEWMMRLLLVRRSCRDVDEELEFHIEKQIEANVAAGMTPREARRQAVIEFGGVQRTREKCREVRPGYRMETLLQDVRYSLRGFRRNPGFAITIVLTLMLGIGATTSVFSVVDRILFRALPYSHADRLVSVGLVAPIEPQEFMLGGSYYDWRDNQKPFAAFTSETGVNPCDLTEEKPVRLGCASVEASFFPMLGVAPILGRNFTVEEDRPNGPKVTLISYGLWQRRFGGDANVLDKMISLDGHSVRIIGVLPSDFEMPRLQAADVALPQALDEAVQRKADPGRPMWAFARLKPGMSIEQAKAELQPVFDYSLRLAPERFRKEVHLQVRSLRDRQMHDVRLIAWVMLGAVLAALLIACANVASLLLARGAARERELAMRSALGASRSRLAAQTLTETLILSLAGATAGCAFAEVLLRIFIAIAPEGLPFLSKAQLDLRVALFAVLISIVCGVLLGLIPALHRPRAEALTGRFRGATSHASARQWLVVAQIAASMVLLVGGMLLLRSFLNLQEQRLGMRTQSVLTARITLGQQHHATTESQMEFFQELKRRLQYGPGVSSLAMSDSLPPGGYHQVQVYASLAVAGRSLSTGGTGGNVAWRWISPDYFRTLDIPIVRGGGFSEAELTSNDRFVVLSELLAARIFPRQDPIGQRLQLAFPGTVDPWYTVVGVAADVKNGGLAGEEEPEYYRLRRDRAEDWNETSAILIKTSLPSESMSSWIRSQVADLDPTVPVEVETMQQRVDKLADQPRFQTVLVGFFAFTGLVLAVIGLYGVIAFLVTQRTQEIGVRIALGASREDILRLVMGRSLRLIMSGTVIGLLAALVASRVLSSLLFGVSPHDSVTFGLVTVLLIAVGIAATLIPAWSAAIVDPMVALRCE